MGVGHFGRLHAEKLAADEMSDLVAVADVDAERARGVAARHGVRAVTDHRELVGAVDAVTIAVPTIAHHEVARFFLEHGVHVLVEKPFASTIAEADDLIALARARGLALQVGHLERFSCFGSGLFEKVTTPLYIEALRIAPFRPRGLDVGVVHDLMIHDIDLVSYLVGAPITSVDAVGAPVLGEREDIVNARITFETGCVATVTASRVAFKSERRLRVFQPDGLLSIDLLNKRGAFISKTYKDGTPHFDVEERTLGEHDSLGSEISSFLHAVAEGTEPVVTGEDGREAMRIADRIGESLRRHFALVQSRALRPGAGTGGAAEDRGVRRRV